MLLRKISLLLKSGLFICSHWLWFVGKLATLANLSMWLATPITQRTKYGHDVENTWYRTFFCDSWCHCATAEKPSYCSYISAQPVAIQYLHYLAPDPPRWPCWSEKIPGSSVESDIVQGNNPTQQLSLSDQVRGQHWGGGWYCHRFLPPANKALYVVQKRKWNEKVTIIPCLFVLAFFLFFLRKIWHIFLHGGDGNLTNTWSIENMTSLHHCRAKCSGFLADSTIRANCEVTTEIRSTSFEKLKQLRSDYGRSLVPATYAK